MSTPPNPEHLLRRPKKPQQKSATPLITAGVAVVVVIVAAIIGVFALAHGRGSANASQTSTVNQVASTESNGPVVPAVVPAPLPKHGHHKPTGPPPLPGASANPSPSATPATTTTTPAPPATSSAHQSTAAIAKAKHEAALAALRKAHAAAASASSGGVTNPLPLPPAQLPTTAPQTATTQAPAAPTPEAAPTPVYAPTVVVDARFASRVSPVYPDIAREQGAQGTAIVLATVGPSGNVLSVSIDQSTGNRLLDNSALDAARQSRFLPPEIDGKPATETYRIVYTFDLNS